MDEWDPAAGAACGIVAPAGGACEGCGGDRWANGVQENKGSGEKEEAYFVDERIRDGHGRGCSRCRILIVWEKPPRPFQVGTGVEVEDGGLVCRWILGWIEVGRRTQRSRHMQSRILESIRLASVSESFELHPIEFYSLSHTIFRNHVYATLV
jgi:hypothetical protein